LIDAEVENLNFESICERVSEFGADLIGMTSTTPFFHGVVEVAEQFKDRCQTPIIVGGTHFSIVRAEAFEDCFDYVVYGEAEMMLGDFLNGFEHGESVAHVPGLMTRNEDGTIRNNGEAPRISNLDDAPRPSRHLLPHKKYISGTYNHGMRPYTSMLMSRGYPFTCVYCATDFYGLKVRRRSVESSLDEIEYLVNEMGFEHIYFFDDTLTLKRKFMLEICAGIKKRGIKFTWEGSTRANLWDEELVTTMKDAGLVRISFGLETSDPEVRELIEKGLPLEDYVVSNRLNNKLGIETINSVMLGMPGDTRESIKETISFLRKARDIQHATYSIAMPYPGIELHRMAKAGEHGLELIEKDYSKYQRYNSAVMIVNGIGPEEMIELQMLGLSQIYSVWWRILPMIRRHGIKAIIPPAISALKLRTRKIFEKLIPHSAGAAAQ
jgi:anaerobic magnesium-protoporphyrin IX monomethyl ester cyclase